MQILWEGSVTGPLMAWAAMEDSAVSRFHFDGAVMLALPVPGPFM